MIKSTLLIVFIFILENLVWAAPIKVFPNQLPRQNPAIVNHHLKTHQVHTISRSAATHSATQIAQDLKKMNPSQSFNEKFMCHGPFKKRVCTRINYF